MKSETEYDDVTELRACLAIAMTKLHQHVIHAGLNFEKRTAKVLDVEPPATIYGWREKWEKAAREFD